MSLTYPSLIAAVKAHLLLPGEELKLADYKRLDQTDREDLRKYFAEAGIKVLSK